MSILFSPKKIGQIEIKNRFVRSATYECRADENGEVTDEMVSFYKTLAKGDVGLIITGFTAVNRAAKTATYINTLYNDHSIPGFKKLADTIHQEGSKVIFQLAHPGMGATKMYLGQKPVAPSRKVKNPFDLSKPKKMTVDEIRDTILDFKEAARRSIEAGADGVQIHAAHTYLVNQFLSPFFNRRDDEWGGTDENRFRFLKEIITEIQEILPPDKLLLIKLNSNDYTPERGIDFELASKYSKWLVELGIDAIEISCGSVTHSPFNVMRGDVPVNEILEFMKGWQKPFVKRIMKKYVGKYNLEGPYNLDAAKVIKPVLGDVPLILVGGIRKAAEMEEIIEKNTADFISMSRPFIREPNLVKKIQEDKDYQTKCVSCNFCTAASLSMILPIRCYNNSYPKKKEYQRMILTAS